jgi:hypothetical protein
MAVRLKARWHKSNRSQRNRENSRKPKTLQDLSSAVAINVWKLAKEVFAHMEKEGFRFAQDEQAIGVVNEIMAFCLHVIDRMIYGRFDEAERALFINGVAAHLIEAMEGNQIDLLGPAEYRAGLVTMLNERISGYAGCGFTDAGPGYDFKVMLGQKVVEVMAASDAKWVVEQVIDIEAPMVVEKLMPAVQGLLGLRERAGS